jgi:hypothetical protein
VPETLWVKLWSIPPVVVYELETILPVVVPTRFRALERTFNMTQETPWVSFAHKDLAISLLIPEGWTVTEPADNQIRFFGPEQPEYNDYQPTWSIALHEPDGFGDQWFTSVGENGLVRLQQEFQGFVLRSTERFMLSSLVEVQTIWYQWEAENDLAFAQVQAYVSVDRYRFYLINGATLTPLADTYLSIYDQIIRTLRILPPYPSQ